MSAAGAVRTLGMSRHSVLESQRSSRREAAYTWDDNGNLTARGGDSFSWDYEDRMTSATVNSVTTNFVYRGDGLRDSRSVSGGATTTFTWDIASGLPVVLDDGNQYVYGAGLTSMKQGGNWYYYLADGLGSTMAVVDSSGVSQKSYTYDVYGEATPTGALANEFDFAGQQTDGTGLQYLRARYYDPETGTFLSREPMADLPNWTGAYHGYSNGRPVSMSDPSGLIPCMDTEGPCGGGVPNARVAPPSCPPEYPACELPTAAAGELKVTQWKLLDEYGEVILDLFQLSGDVALLMGGCLLVGGGICLIGPTPESNTSGQVGAMLLIVTGTTAATTAGGIQIAMELEACQAGNGGACVSGILQATTYVVPNSADGWDLVLDTVLWELDCLVKGGCC